MKHNHLVFTEELGFHERLQQKLSTYPEKTVHKDGTVTIEQVNNPYFLINDKWNINFLGEIKQFEEMVATYKYSSKNVAFQFMNPNVNLEVKYVFYQRLFNDYWTINSILGAQSPLKRITEFLNQKYPTLSSLLDLNINKVEKEYLFWLSEKGINTQWVKKRLLYEDTIIQSKVASFLRIVFTTLLQITDMREEWEKDRWDIRVLHAKYGIDYNKSNTNYYIDFTKVKQLNMCQQIKKYIKQRLLSKNKFSVGTAQAYMQCLPNFLTFIFSLEPTWMDLKGLKRSHIKQYILRLHEYSKNNLKRKDAHPERYVTKALNHVGKFIEDIQRYEYDIAPETNVRLLFFPEDKPKLRKKPIDHIDYIPDYVLEQLFTYINDLPKDVIPVVWVAFKTGLRISDVLGLTIDCLIKLNGNYSIVTDIEKTYVQGHRIPIDEELANLLAVLIQRAKENSNQDNNPERFIFIRYRGSRKGKPFAKSWVQRSLKYISQTKEHCR